MKNISEYFDKGKKYGNSGESIILRLSQTSVVYSASALLTADLLMDWPEPHCSL
jgi:hypothetical protein